MRGGLKMCTGPGHASPVTAFSRGLCSGHYQQSYRGRGLRPLRGPKGALLEEGEWDVVSVRVPAKARDAIAAQARAVGLTVRAYLSRVLEALGGPL